MEWDFTGLSNEEIIARCQSILGCRSAAEIEADKKRKQEAYEREQAQYKEWYDDGVRVLYSTSDDGKTWPLLKRACPTCGTVFYTTNDRKIYDDYYQCAPYVHQTRAKFRRRANRVTDCELCGKTFIPDRAGAKYCSAACKQKAYRERKRGSGGIQNEYKQ